MKKKVIILIPLSFHLKPYCQKANLVTVPCSDSFLLSIKGTYHFEGLKIVDQLPVSRYR